jgi:hypothetical protein
VRVAGIRRTEVAEGVEWSATVTFADQERTVRFGGPAELVGRADATPFLAATLLPAMAWQQDLEVDGPVSPRVLARVDRIARLYHLMDPTLRPPTVTATEAPAPAGDATGHAIACFFSRGVDSTYSAAVDRIDPGPLDALLYCRSLEPNHEPATSDRELAMARRVAERLGLPVHVIWTDLRAFTDPMLGWSTVHGSGLAALALLVGQAFDHVVVPTAYDIASLVPCGSHPALEPTWSSELVTVHHDHLDRSRQGKLDWLVAHRPEALELLKVCYSEDRVDNCGRCHKCLLTQAGLRAAGGLHLATQFPTGLDLDLIRAQRVAGVGLRHLWLAIAHRAAEQGDTELADAVGDLLRLSAVPSLGELLRGRSRLLDRALGPARSASPDFDPERATTFERIDRAQTNAELALLRHGEVLAPGAEPPARRLRASTLAGSVAASIAHRRRR